MMEEDNLRRHIHALVRDHRNDKDGGYELARVLRRFGERCSDDAERKKVWQALVCLAAAAREGTGAALFALGSANALPVAEDLVLLLEKRRAAKGWRRRPKEWRDEVCRALLRMRPCPATGACRAYVVSELDAGRRPVLSLLAALSIHDSETGIPLAARCFAEGVPKGEAFERVAGYAPAFVNSLHKKDDALLVRLVALTAEADAERGEKLKKAIIKHLDLASTKRLLGADSVRWLRETLG